MLAGLDQAVGVGGVIDQFVWRESQQVGRIRIERREIGEIVGIRHPGPVIDRRCLAIRQAHRQLEMQVRLPATVHRRRAEGREQRPGPKPVARLQTGNAGRVEMAIQGEKGIPVIGRMAQHDSAAIILRVCAVDGGHHLALQRRVDRPAVRREQVDADMHGPAPLDRCRCRQIAFGRIDKPRLEIMADMHRLAIKGGGDQPVAFIKGQVRRIRRQHRIPHRDGTDRRIAERRPHHRRKPVPVRPQPAADSRRAVGDAEPGRHPKPHRHLAPVPAKRLLQKGQRRRLADRHIGVVGMFARHDRAVHQRHAKPHHHQREDHPDLLRRHRTGGGITLDQRRQRLHRPRLVQHHIGCRRREVTHRRRPDHVTEIDHPGKGRAVQRRADEEVVVIAVAMNSLIFEI